MRAIRVVIFVSLFMFLAGCHSPPRFSESVPHRLATGFYQSPVWTGYDASFADAIQSRWLQLLDQQMVPEDSGRVVLEFLLHPDGTIDDLSIAENTEGAVLAAMCAKAVLDPAPFRPWTEQMENLFGPARRFRVSFEFDIRGTPYVAYTEGLMELARGGRNPGTTLIVLNHSHRPARPVSQAIQRI